MYCADEEKNIMADKTMKDDKMNDSLLNEQEDRYFSRFSRQIALPWIGKDKQLKVSEKKIVIIGCGALGTHSAESLLRSGVRKMTLIDDDVVDESNLQRQALYKEEDISEFKAETLKKHLNEIDSQAEITVHIKRISDRRHSKYIIGDIVLDCTDNIDSRNAIDSICKEKKIPWIHAAVVGKRGIVKTFFPEDKRYDELFPNKKTPETCRGAGVLNNAVMMVSSIQAGEALKMLLGQKPSEDIIRIDAWNFSISYIHIKLQK